MMTVLVALMLGPSSAPAEIVRYRDRAFSPTPVTDKDLRPGKPRDCESAEEVQITLRQIKAGDKELCFIRDASAFKRTT